MKLDRNLNIVLRLKDESDQPFIIHSTPIPSAVFDVNWRVFRSAYEEIISEGMGSAVSLAERILLDAAKRHNSLDAITELLQTLRGATVAIRGSSVLLDHSDLSEDMKEEVVNRLIFFITSYRHILASQMKAWLPAISTVLDLELTSSTVQDLLLSPSTEVESSKTISPTKEPTGSTVTSVPI